MKKIIALLLALSLLLCGCSELIPAKTTVESDQARLAAEAAQPIVFAETQPVIEPETSEPETEPETQPETEPETEPEPEYFNPLNGEILDEPFDRRFFAVSINNLRDALPHSNVINADLYFESFVNGSIIRGLAVFSNPLGIPAIGPVRSNRMMFNDICMHYDCVMVHAGGSWEVVDDTRNKGIDNFNIDAWDVMQITSFRDEERYHSGYGWEHCLYAIGDGIVDYSEQQGIRTDINPDLDFNLLFTDDGTPENGVPAENIDVTITTREYRKNTGMYYDADLGKYVYNQYEMSMVDAITGEPEAFRNVLILMGNMFFDYSFERINMLQGGEGWFACGGKAIPIRWGAADEHSPLWFTTMDGEPLVLGRGNTYIAITETGSKIVGIGDAEE